MWSAQPDSAARRFTAQATIGHDDLGVGPSGTALIAIATEGISRSGERFLTHLWRAPQMRKTTSRSATGNDRSGFSEPPCAISADARQLASQRLGITVIKDAATDQVVAKLGAASDGPCAFSPDGTRFATSGAGFVRVWEVGTQTEIARIETPQAVSRLTFSPTNRYLASAGDGVARIWLLDHGDLIALACSRATRNLAADEKQSYFGVAPYTATCGKLPVPENAPQ
jgi:WD40 repeat protein